MREDVRAMLERQAAWQRSRAALPWAEKLRLALIMRKAQRALQEDLKHPAGRSRKPGSPREGANEVLDARTRSGP